MKWNIWKVKNQVVDRPFSEIIPVLREKDVYICIYFFSFSIYIIIFIYLYIYLYLSIHTHTHNQWGRRKDGLNFLLKWNQVSLVIIWFLSGNVKTIFSVILILNIFLPYPTNLRTLKHKPQTYLVCWNW